jgi:dynein heavy chain, axonemal
LHLSRFYFLSNDELLEVLSETKEPRLVRVDKCFAGVKSIILGADGEIESVESPDGERLVLSGSRLVPSETSVERWLSQLEEALARSLKDTCREAVAAYQRNPREVWATHWPAQAVSVASHIHWTTDAAAALRNNALKVKFIVLLIEVEMNLSISGVHCQE